MGDQAEAMIDGEVCSLCGCFFEKDHGYPVVCKDCYRQLSSGDKKNHQRAIYDTI